MGQYLFVLSISWCFIYPRAVVSLRELQKAMSGYRLSADEDAPSLPTQCVPPAERTSKSLVGRDGMALA
jgi:hypothetical protein